MLLADVEVLASPGIANANDLPQPIKVVRQVGVITTSHYRLLSKLTAQLSFDWLNRTLKQGIAYRRHWTRMRRM